MKSQRPMHVDYLVQLTVQESIFNIQLIDHRVVRDCYAKDISNRFHFDKQVKCLTAVYTRSLTFLVCNHTGFIPSKRTICLAFLPKQSHRLDNISPHRPQNKYPCLDRNKSTKFIIYGNGPVRDT